MPAILRLLRAARSKGYDIELHYLWLAKAGQAIARVRQRVRAGGHDVPERDIRRRFERGLVHMIRDYLPLTTRWVIWDNRNLPGKVLASSATHAIDEVARILDL